MSASGKYQVVIAYGNYIYLSSDYGVSFSTATAPVKNWICVTMSMNGSYIAAGTDNEYIYVSTDFGNTWKAKMSDNPRNWGQLRMSGTGEHLWAYNDTNLYYVKHDSIANVNDLIPTTINSNIFLLDCKNSNNLYVTAPSSNFILSIINLPLFLNSSVKITLYIITSSFRTYATTLYMSNNSNQSDTNITRIKENGNAITVNASSSMIIQEFTFVYTSSINLQCVIENVTSYL